MAYPYLKPHILFDSNGLAIWSDVPATTHIKKIIAVYLPSVQILPSFELIKAISEMDIWHKFWSDT